LQYSNNTENSIGNTCQYQYNIAILTTRPITSQTLQSTVFQSGLFGSQSSGPMNCGVSWARKAKVSQARCAGALSCWNTNVSQRCYGSLAAVVSTTVHHCHHNLRAMVHKQQTRATQLWDSNW